MRIVSKEEMRIIDAKAINELNIPSMVLMENAGRSVYEFVISIFKDKKNKNIVIVAGKGNNGGDGIVLARYLLNHNINQYIGHNIGHSIFLLENIENYKADAKNNLDIYIKSGGNPIILENSNLHLFTKAVNNSSLIVDAIFGTGLSNNITGFTEKIINLINKSGKQVVSVDIPSGIDGTSGLSHGCSIRANWTVTFQNPKTGIFQNDGIDAVGEITVTDIGIPGIVVNNNSQPLSLLTLESLDLKYLKRKKNTHKGTYGHLLVVAGSRGKTGAAKMAGISAIRAGAGLVTLAVPECIIKSVDKFCLETMAYPLNSKDGLLSKDCIPNLLNIAQDKKALLIGPGITKTDDNYVIIQELLKKLKIPIIIDADGLNSISINPHLLKNRKCDLVITPHPGEMSRLLGISVSDVEKDRINIAINFSKKNNLYTILKGSRSVLAFPDGRAFVSPYGNPGMATGGSGDVLAGLIGGFLVQKIPIEEALKLGLYVHGKSGDMARDEIGETSLSARDLIKFSINVIKNLEKR